MLRQLLDIFMRQVSEVVVHSQDQETKDQYEALDEAFRYIRGIATDMEEISNRREGNAAALELEKIFQNIRLMSYARQILQLKDEKAELQRMLESLQHVEGIPDNIPRPDLS